MDEFTFSNTIMLMVLAGAIGAGVATLPGAATRFIGAFSAVALGLIAFMAASQEAIMWLSLR